jgi:hypothetical protein
MKRNKPLYKRLGCIPITLIVLSIMIIGSRELMTIFRSATGAQPATVPGADTVDLAVLRLFSYALLFIALFFLSVSLLSLFVIPIKGINDYMGAFGFMWRYVLRKSGPFIRVLDGKIIIEPEEKTVARQGIVLVDFNSAVLLGEERVVGPGLSFKSKGEKVRGAVDLRKQVCHRKDIQGNTRDGIKVQTRISVTFTLSEEPETLYVTSSGQDWKDIRVVAFDEGNSQPAGVKKVKYLTDALIDEDKKEIYQYVYEVLKPHRHGPKSNSEKAQSYAPPTRNSSGSPYLPFSFDPKRVVAAVNARLRDVVEGRFTDWKDYPAYVATAIFRDKLIHENFDDLCLPEDPDKNPLRDFKELFSKTVQCRGLIAAQYVVSRDGSPFVVGKEYSQSALRYYPAIILKSPTTLRERGIKVIQAGFSELIPVEDDVKEQMFKSWQARWIREEKETQADNDLKAVRIRNRARVRAQRDMVYALSQIFKTDSDARPDLSTEALAVRVFQALETIATDPHTRQLLSKEALALLNDLHKWLLAEPDKGEVKP